MPKRFRTLHLIKEFWATVLIESYEQLSCYTGRMVVQGLGFISMVSNNLVLAFDAYGTLLSTESIAKKLATHFGDEKAASISVKWRVYQLEYTWRLNSMSW